MNPIALRLLSQQLAAPQFKDPAEVVAWFGAMQAQDYKGMRWAVSMRTRKPSGKAFEKAYNDGRIIRTHLLRTTWQLLAGEDLGWMLALCRPRALAGLRGWMHANGVDIPEEEEKRISDIFADALAGQGSVQKEFLAEALHERDIHMTEQRFSYHLRLAELSGLLCSGDLHPTKRTLALVSEKVRHPLVLPREEALALLTRKYFRSHGPATLEDFAWWSGLGLLDCRRGIASLGDELVAIRWKERGRSGGGLRGGDGSCMGDDRSGSDGLRRGDGLCMGDDRCGSDGRRGMVARGMVARGGGGLCGGDGRRGMVARGGSGERTFYVSRDARTRGFRSGSVLLLPPFDEYLIGYKSRDIVLHPTHSHHAHNNSGIFYPIVALDGKIVGNWSPTAPDGALRLFDAPRSPIDGEPNSIGSPHSTIEGEPCSPGAIATHIKEPISLPIESFQRQLASYRATVNPAQ